MAWNLPALGVLVSRSRRIVCYRTAARPDKFRASVGLQGAQYCAAICTQYVNYKEIVKSILYDLSTGKRLVRSVAAKYGDACNFMTRLLKASGPFVLLFLTCDAGVEITRMLVLSGHAGTAVLCEYARVATLERCGQTLGQTRALGAAHSTGAVPGCRGPGGADADVEAAHDSTAAGEGLRGDCACKGIVFPGFASPRTAAATPECGLETCGILVMVIVMPHSS